MAESISAISADSSSSKVKINTEKYIKKAKVKHKVIEEKKIVSILRKVGFPEHSLNELVCTAKSESSFNPKATHVNNNGTTDSGLFQINDIWLRLCNVTRLELLNPWVNAKCAKKVFTEQGLSAWMAFNSRERFCRSYDLQQDRRIVHGIPPAKSVNKSASAAPLKKDGAYAQKRGAALKSTPRPVLKLTTTQLKGPVTPLKITPASLKPIGKKNSLQTASQNSGQKVVQNSAAKSVQKLHSAVEEQGARWYELCRTEEACALWGSLAD